MGEHGKDPRFAAFYGLMVVEARITERLDAALEAEAGISLSRLELLLHLHWKDGRRRMSDLADALLLSRGGATRLVAKAEEEGLVRREIPPDDRRATYAVLTDAGREAAERGFPIYTELQTKLFQEHVTDEEAEMLVRIWNRVLDANGSPCEPISAAAAELAT
ncbi:MAG: MarR family transcriptional regulator [Solirubrobacteraceae bacterium]